MTEELKSAIEKWQKDDCDKRAILVIAIEELERTEEKTTCNTDVAVMGSGKLLVEAVKETRKNGGVPANIFRKADFILLMEKLCE